MLGVTDPFVAFCIDRAVWFLAGTIEEQQEAAVTRLPQNAKESAHARTRQKVLDMYLGVELVDEPQRFRAPVQGG
jgi:hypothetical protein